MTESKQAPKVIPLREEPFGRPRVVEGSDVIVTGADDARNAGQPIEEQDQQEDS